MNDYESEMLSEIKKISSLLELLADDKIAQRDKKLRTALLEIVGTIAAKQKSVFMMNGVRTQKEIYSAAGVKQSTFNDMVAKLHKARLLVGDTNKPHLAISIPSTFFESNAETE